MISRIVDKHLYQELNNTDSDTSGVNDEEEQYLLGAENDLKKVFEIYCSYGEPMNTKYLKSSKIIKMLKESGLLKGS